MPWCATVAPVIALVLAGCAAFGAADQYVGSLTRFWSQAWEIPALSAPWLLLPFLVGRTQRSPWRAALAGAVGTLVGLAAYGAMTISPVEHAQFTLAGFVAFARSNLLWFLGSALTGPAFGYLGHRWRLDRSRLAAVAAAGAVVLEPFVHASVHRPAPLSAIPLRVVTGTELAIGLAMAAWFARQSVGRSVISSRTR